MQCGGRGLSAWFPLDYSGFEDVRKQSAVEIGALGSGRVGAALDAGAERDILIAPQGSLDIGSSAGWSIEFWLQPANTG